MKRTKNTSKKGLKRLFCWVPDSVHRKAKARAAIAGETLDNYLADLVARDVEGNIRPFAEASR